MEKEVTVAHSCGGPPIRPYDYPRWDVRVYDVDELSSMISIKGEIYCPVCYQLAYVPCKICKRPMYFDDAPTCGWCCDYCKYRLDVSGVEWLNHELYDGEKS